MEICDCFFFLFIYICNVICEPIIIKWGPSWSWSYGSWIYSYPCNQCISPLTFFFIWILLTTIQHYVINFVYVTNVHVYVPFIVSTCRSFSRSWLITRVSRQVSLVKQELPTLQEHPSSLPVFREVRVARSLVVCVMFCRSLFVLMSFIFWSFFNLQILITPLTSSDDPFDIFWWPLWHLLMTPLTSSDYPFDIFKLFLSVIFSGYLSFPPTIKLTATI
jgi:hypothetical protein